MALAMEQARQAFAAGELPVGAVAVREGAVVGRAHNQVERQQDPTAHAEMLCLREVARRAGSWRLPGTTLYVTLGEWSVAEVRCRERRGLTHTPATTQRRRRGPHVPEPCPMCAGALLQARVDRVVWGAPNPRLGADGSWISMLSRGPEAGQGHGGGGGAPVHPFHTKLAVTRGVLQEECSEILKDFFRRRREGAI